MHKIRGTHVQRMYNVCTCLYTVCTCKYNVHESYHPGQDILRGYILSIFLSVQSGWFLSDSIVHICDKGGTGEYAVDVASHAWVVGQLKRLMTGRRLLWRSGACAELRLAGDARLIGPNEKWIVVVKLYRRVCTMSIHIFTFMNVYVPCT